MAKIRYSYQAKQLSKKTEIQLCKILDASGIKEALVIRSTRTPDEQAHIMFAECEQYGVKHQATIYGPAGRQVIDVYAKCRAARLVQEQAKIRMAEMIEVVGPRLVSDHCTIDKRLDILDIGSSSIPAEKKTIFEMHVEDCSKVKKFSMHENSYHIEMLFNS